MTPSVCFEGVAARRCLRAALSGTVVLGSLALASSSLALESATKGPYVTTLSDRDATVRFELGKATPASVDVVAEGGSIGDGGRVRSTRFESSESSTMHVVRASGLEPATRYAYTVVAGGVALATGHWVTAPSSDSNEPRSFIVYGDDRTDDEAHAAVVRAISAVPSDFLVNTGDMVADGGNAANWSTFFDIERGLLRERALFVAIGNHELYDDVAGANFARYFGFPDASGAMHPYGTVRFGAIRLFFLNGMHEWDGGPEREWLESELSRADNEPGLVWRFAVVHHGPWSSGPHGPNQKLVEARVPELLGAHKVDLLFCGHDHIYERGDAGILKYIVSGGGGAPLYRDLHPTPTTRKAEAAYHFVEVTTRGNTLQMVARRVDGSVLDQCGFAKGSRWDCDAPSSPSGRPSGSRSSDADSTDAGRVKPSVAPAARSSACFCDAPGAPAGGPSVVSASLIGLVAIALRRRPWRRDGGLRLRRAGQTD